MHDVCTTHIRQNSVHGYPKLLVVKRSFTVRVRARDREWIFHSFFYLKSDKNTFVLASWPKACSLIPWSLVVIRCV